jgi:hypothetical protein
MHIYSNMHKFTSEFFLYNTHNKKYKAVKIRGKVYKKMQFTTQTRVSLLVVHFKKINE